MIGDGYDVEARIVVGANEILRAEGSVTVRAVRVQSTFQPLPRSFERIDACNRLGNDVTGSRLADVHVRAQCSGPNRAGVWD